MINSAKKILVLLFFFGSVKFCFGQDTIIYKLDLVEKKLPFGLVFKDFSNKPKLGLALSGGGSRGLSQIGVLKAFQENAIPIDYIVGTSMGSIVGGLYASGYSINDIDSIVTNADWEELFNTNEANRRELFIDQKITEDKAIFALRFDGLKPVLPTSIISGQKVTNFLSLLEINAPLHFYNTFDDLLFDFRAVATDLITGKMVVLSDGSLAKAMRASSSISLLLSPVKIDSLLLVDGGLVANIPSGVVKNLNSDIIIAVNSTSPLNKREELAYPWVIADQMVSIPMSIISNKQLENADFIIVPELSDLKNDNFLSIPNSINAGYLSALPLIDSIKNYYKSSYLSKIGYPQDRITDFTFFFDDRKIKDKLTPFFNNNRSLNLLDLYYQLYYIYLEGCYKDLWFETITDSNSTKISIMSEYNKQIETIRIEGITQLDVEKCYGIYKELVDKPYSSKAVLNKTLELLRLYRKNGYSLAEIEKIKFDEEKKELFLHVSEGFIEKIIVSGNISTNPEVILREFPLEEGKYFEFSKVEQGIISLRSTNLFDEIELTIDKNGQGNIFKINVLEKNPAVLRFGFRVDNENQAQISLDLRDENVYGTGTELGATFSGGVRNRTFLTEYKSNRLFNTFFTFKLKGYYDLLDINLYTDDTVKNANRFKRVKDSEYRQINYGVSFGVGSQVGKIGNFIIEARYEANEIKNKTDYIGSIFKLNLAAIKFDLTIDSQDRFPYPRNGFYVKTFYETAQQNFGSDIGYTKFYSNYVTTFTIKEKHTLSTRFTLGFADETLPLSQQFNFGGQNSFFGYRDYEFRGRQILVTSFSYRYFLPVKLFFDSYVKFRYDLGSIWSSRQEIRFKDLKHGIGATLSLDTPIGPADFAVGRSFYLRQGGVEDIFSWGDVFFYFTIGYAY
ncbi:MAG: patatin-like phospholipase family protein [bacterium]